jgi:hypothetical protein
VSGGFQQVVDLVNGPADALYQAASVDRLAVAVVEAAPFSIRLDEPKSALAQDGTIALIVNVDRAADFKGAIDITFPFLPPWVDGPAKLTIPSDKSSGVYVAHAFPQAAPRTWHICAEARPGLDIPRDATTNAAPGVPSFRGGRGRRSRGGNDAVVSSQLVALTIAPSPVTGLIGKIATEQGTTKKIVCSMAAREKLPSELTATLEGLPNRVQAKSVTVSGTDKNVEFAIQLDGTAPLGVFNSPVCRLTGTVDGQEVSYCIGRGGELKIDVPGALVTDKSGRPLSPLEVLRQNQQKASGSATKSR